MIVEGIAGLGALKSAFDMAKGLKDINDTVVRNGAIIELKENILAAQQAQAALTLQISNLEKEVAELKAWDAEKQNYKLGEVANGIVVYVPNDVVEPAKASHKLCANCFEDGKKSHLQIEIRSPGRATVAVCNRCHAELYITGMRQPEHPRRR
jgi:hypothetical protein